MTATIVDILSLVEKSPEELRIEMLESERRLGYWAVTEAEWLDWDDWDRDTIVSKCNNRVRLVLLKAKVPGQGAFTRLIERIKQANLVPIIAEPNALLIDWCLRHEFRSRKVAIGTRDEHVVWYPRLVLNF